MRDAIRAISSSISNGLGLVTRTNHEFNGRISEEEKIIYSLYLNKAIRAHKPRKMFKDFPELEDFV